ncbi:MAG: hypothetical protein KAG61_12580 [Bacteriovoracaceae bacterium]|nr:hypothetical protein [Bacteriovoracaceae bacterium]
MDLSNVWTLNDLVSNAQSIKRIFFYRICGTGMGAAACLLKEAGHEVEGGDSTFAPPMSDYLDTTGIPCHSFDQMDFEYMKSFDLIVVGNVVAKASEEARKLEALGPKLTSFPSALGAFVLRKQNVVGISGTHGKTTTTYLLSQMFDKLGMNPGHFVGGVIEGEKSARLGDGSYFFIESDEYDCAYFEKVSKFRRYSIDHLIITSLEFDHGDIFDTIEDIKDEFRALLPEIAHSIIYDSSYQATVELTDEFPDKKWFSYGNEKLGPEVLAMGPEGTTFSLMIDGRREEFFSNVVGHHNILNLTTGIILAFRDGIGLGRIRESIKGLSMVKRRQEERGVYNGALVIDDFAHHPRAVSLTIDTIKVKYPGKEVIVVMEPNSATARSSIFQEEFAISLEKADYVIMARPMRDTTLKDYNNLDCDSIVAHLKEKEVGGEVISELPELLSSIDRNIDDNKLLLILSNGTCLGLWSSVFVNELK